MNLQLNLKPLPSSARLSTEGAQEFSNLQPKGRSQVTYIVTCRQTQVTMFIPVFMRLSSDLVTLGG